MMLVLEIALGVAFGMLIRDAVRRPRALAIIGRILAVTVVLAGLAILAIGAIFFRTAYPAAAMRALDAAKAIAETMGIFLLVIGVAVAFEQLEKNWMAWDRKKRRDVAVGGGGLYALIALSMTMAMADNDLSQGLMIGSVFLLGPCLIWAAIRWHRAVERRRSL